ncbi:MAG: hypothetical protein GF346_06145 [Candidatus Eisenbacteria bacterium]|nr:hypothetical protein [Candidatus Latescibacterota bacterium]MBD3302006.1 hypothetical protein [Candidatus Eisenbacteria bacterium]
MRAWWTAAMTVLLLAGLATAGTAQDLIPDGDFEAESSSRSLRVDNKGPDWQETRKDGPEGRKLLFLSTKEIAGNATQKAMIKAHPEKNTYLSRYLGDPQRGIFSVRVDILVKEILDDDNRTAFIMLGNDRDNKRGPCSTGKERLVFLGFENAEAEGKMNLFARERGTGWSETTRVAGDLELGKWYTIRMMIYVMDESYEVWVDGVTKPREVEGFRMRPKTGKAITHISFASWNDGAGTFYVDNVAAEVVE